MSGSDRRRRSSARRGWAGAVFGVPPAGIENGYPGLPSFVRYTLALIVVIVVGLGAALVLSPG
ncbi:hypothetical protein [Marinivivus vitaminiproducens]|uniref:hypothetical protein n=1 Tax=Marinivivus vitaminiproducens TaxID=3035935 RepID=UPI0027AAFD70|nr:hypothetical protein P4R82_09775 [Geminicoccaceae bacterium SCSIO 64248]